MASLVQEAYRTVLFVYSAVQDFVLMALFYVTSFIHELYARYFQLKLLAVEVRNLAYAVLGVERAQREVAEVNCQTAVNAELLNRLKDGEWAMNNSKTDRLFLNDQVRQTKTNMAKLGEKYEEKRSRVLQRRPDVWLAAKRVQAAAAALGLIRRAPNVPANPAIQAEAAAVEEREQRALLPKGDAPKLPEVQKVVELQKADLQPMKQVQTVYYLDPTVAGTVTPKPSTSSVTATPPATPAATPPPPSRTDKKVSPLKASATVPFKFEKGIKSEYAM